MDLGAVRPTRGSWMAPLICSCVWVVSSCAASSAGPPAPTVDVGEIARDAELGSELDVPYRLMFEWAATEPGSRLSGSGVARIEPPAMVRLDLFASNGERVAAAALNGDDLRIASGVQTRIPPAPLLWGALGVFRPGLSALAGGRMYPSGELEVRYLTPAGEELLYRMRDERFDRIEVASGGRALEEVTLTRVEEERFPRRAVYRHLAEVVELQITLESVEHVESYPTDIWTLGF